MASEIVGLVAACDRDLLRSLIETIAPGEAAQIDWSMTGRDLGARVRDALVANEKVWVYLQRIVSLVRHGTRSTIPSVLHEHPGLRAEFEEIPEGQETAAVWLAFKDAELFECALSALHVDQGLSKRSWLAFRARLSKGDKLAFDETSMRRFESLVREAIRRCQSFDNPGALATHHFRLVPLLRHRGPPCLDKAIHQAGPLQRGRISAQ